MLPEIYLTVYVVCIFFLFMSEYSEYRYSIKIVVQDVWLLAVMSFGLQQVIWLLITNFGVCFLRNVCTTLKLTKTIPKKWYYLCIHTLSVQICSIWVFWVTDHEFRDFFMNYYYFTVKLAKTTLKMGIFAIFTPTDSRFDPHGFFGSLITNFRVKTTKIWHFTFKIAKT